MVSCSMRQIMTEIPRVSKNALSFLRFGFKCHLIALPIMIVRVFQLAKSSGKKNRKRVDDT